MTPENWKKVKAAFNQAVELQTADREELLALAEEDVRLQVKRMLAADSFDLFAHSPINKLIGESTSYQPPERIGSYKIIREIGRGGMGTVFEAARDDGEFVQKVALKIIRRGMDSDDILRRFRNERQILAGLRHPNIAFITDGGISESGAPFYTMEFIEGTSINTFCREQHLSTDEKFELFRKVCAAVSYAHNNLIVHRDLKPSNILVTKDGEPKLLDFGIAKVLHPNTEDDFGTATQFGMMTPAYASPEQLRGEKVSTATDVYSLGIILYELLTGEKPFKTEGKGFGEILGMVSSIMPPKPSEASIQRGIKTPDAKISRKPGKPNVLKNDVDVIVFKAIQKEVARRYSSVEQFSEDIRRHLNKLPITARPDTFSYRCSKFIKRNKIGLASTVLIFLSLCAGITVALWQAHEARAERAQAEKRFNEVRQLANNVVFKYQDAIADIQGTTTAREMLVRDALQYLDNLSAEAENGADLQEELGRAYLKLGDVQGKMYDANTGNTAGAKLSYQKAVELLELVVKNKPADIQSRENLIKAYSSLAFLRLRAGSTLETEKLVEKGAALFKELQTLDPQTDRRLQLIELYVRLGDVAVLPTFEGTDFNKRLEKHLQALPIIEEVVQADSGNYEKVKTAARVYQRLGSDYIWLGQRTEQPENAPALYAKSLEYASKSFAMTQKMVELAPDSATTKRYLSAGYNNLAESLMYNQKFDEALAAAKNNYKLSMKTFRADSDNKEAKFSLSTCYELYAKIYLQQKNYDKYLEFTGKMLAIDEELLQGDPKNVEVADRIYFINSQIADVYQKNNNLQKAQAYRERAQKAKTYIELLKNDKS